MRISIIVAMDENNAIGINNGLPWKLPSDMKWFRQHTLGKPIIMGRNTFESFGAKPLPKRQNIIVTHNTQYHAENCDIVFSIDAAFNKVQITECPDSASIDEVMIIGGASFYEQTITIADRMYLTIVHTTIKGDAWFPRYQASDWQETFKLHHQVDDENNIAHTFYIFDKKNNSNC